MSDQRIIVFEQQGSGEAKIRAVTARGRGMHITTVVDIRGPLPSLIDDSREYLPEVIDADLALSFLSHPDLALDVATLCSRQGVPLVASGQRIDRLGVHCPPT